MTRLAVGLSSALAVLALAAACSLAPLEPKPSPPPPSNLKAGDADQDGLFYMSPGQTLLVELPYASSRDKAVLAVAGHYPKAVLFRAVAVGRTTLMADDYTPCPIECNPPGPLRFAVTVVSELELQQGLAISEKDQPWIGGRWVIHLRTGQPLVLTLANQPGSPDWVRISSDDPAVIAPEQPSTISAAGIRRLFQAGKPGETEIVAVGPGCLSRGACPPGSFAVFSFQVFS